MEIVSLITVRSSSSRLPEKCFYKFGNQTVLHHVIKRAIDNKLNPIICTTSLPEDDRIIDISKSFGIPFFRGPSLNKLLRWKLCCDRFSIKNFHTIDADDPFFCPKEIKRSFMALKSKDIDIVIPYKSSSNGGAMLGYSIKTKLINNALSSIPESTDTEMAWSFLVSKDTKGVLHLQAPKNHEIEGRLTLDYWEDYIFLEALRLILGEDTSRRNIFNILNSNKQLQNINSFRGYEWKRLQTGKLKNNILPN